MGPAPDQYIGSTTTDFRIRFRNHKSAMLTNKTTCEVAVHFNKTSHILDEFSLFKPHGLNKEKNFILGIEFIINLLFCDSSFPIYGRSKALFLDFVSLLGVGYTQRPCPGNLLRSLLFKDPPGILLSIGPLGLQRPRFGILL